MDTCRQPSVCEPLPPGPGLGRTLRSISISLTLHSEAGRGRGHVPNTAGHIGMLKGVLLYLELKFKEESCTFLSEIWQPWVGVSVTAGPLVSGWGLSSCQGYQTSVIVPRPEPGTCRVSGPVNAQRTTDFCLIPSIDICEVTGLAALVTSPHSW